MDRTPKEMANRLGEIYRNIHEFITYAKSEKHEDETDEYDIGIFCVLRDLLKAYYSLMETKFKNNKVINEFLDEEFLRILPAVREKFLTFSNTLYAFCRDMFTLDPPPKFEFGDGIKGSKIDTELFTCYKRQGEIVDCVLWPALVSRSDDSVYEKGIVKAQVLETNSELQDKLAALRMKLANTEKERDQFLEERNAALTRQSAHAGKRLRDIDAAVLDVSPISLGEKFSELYENQWTDALEAMEALNISEVEGIKRLYAIVMLIYEECRIHSETQMDSLKKVMGLDGTDGDAMKKLKDFRKSVAGQYIVTVKKDVISCEAMRQRHEEKSHCMNYINRCIELCWFMQVQDPPVVLDFTMKPGMEIDEKIYRFFTKTGRIVDFVVWPVMMLHNNGPLLQKGVVQPSK